MAKTKKVKISSAKRSQHLKSKKRNNKIQLSQVKAEKLKKRSLNNKTNEKLSSIKDKSDNRIKKQKRKHGKSNIPDVINDLNDEQILENVHDILEDEDKIENYPDEIGGKRSKRYNSHGPEDESKDLEIEYTNKQFAAHDDSKMEIDLLPIKNKEGEIITRTTKVDIVNYYNKEKAELQEDVQSNEEEEEEDSDDDIVYDESMATQVNVENKKFITTTDLLILREQEIQKQKYRIGIICSGILEKPDEKLKHFKVLFNLMDERNESGAFNFFTIRKLACISIAEVFKDIIPEYRVGQVDPKMTTVRKATLERVTYENNLLQHFKKYLTKLERITSAVTKKSSKGDSKMVNKEKLGEVAVICLCELLSSHTYFNYVQNVAQLLVYMLNCNYKSIRDRVNQCFKNLFETDKRCDMTLFIIRRINHLIKNKPNNAHLEMITCFMSLKIKNVNLDAEKESELKVKKLENYRQKLWNLSKKERKRQKKLRELNKELQETNAEENKQTKHYKLTEITKMVFTIYFRILKNDPNSKLLSACLEGLAEFAHVINLEFFSDLIEVLHSLLEGSELGYREELHCIETIFAILSGQGEVLNIDPIRFYGHLYRNILHVDAGHTHNDTIIVLRVLNDVLVKRRKNISGHRLLAFVKRISTLSLQLLHNGTLGCLGVIKNLLQLSSALETIIDTDCSIGSGKFDPWLEDPEYCNAACSSLYETFLLAHHYHPTVRKLALFVASGAPISGKSFNPEIGKLTFEELYKQFDSSQMAFNPEIPVPKFPIVVKEPKGPLIDSEFVKTCKMNLEEIGTKQFNFYEEIVK